MKSELLIQKGTGHIFVATPELKKRKDMAPYNPEKKADKKPAVDDVAIDEAKKSAAKAAVKKPRKAVGSKNDQKVDNKDDQKPPL